MICHNSRTSADINMKLGRETTLGKRNKTTSKKFDDDFMSEKFSVVFIFKIFNQFGSVRSLDSGHRFCESYDFINSNIWS